MRNCRLVPGKAPRGSRQKTAPLPPFNSYTTGQIITSDTSSTAKIVPSNQAGSSMISMMAVITMVTTIIAFFIAQFTSVVVCMNEYRFIMLLCYNGPVKK